MGWLAVSQIVKLDYPLFYFFLGIAMTQTRLACHAMLCAHMQAGLQRGSVREMGRQACMVRILGYPSPSIAFHHICPLCPF